MVKRLKKVAARKAPAPQPKPATQDKPAAPFKPGDIVELLSGSPGMTVEDTDQYEGGGTVHVMYAEHGRIMCRTVDQRAVKIRVEPAIGWVAFSA